MDAKIADLMAHGKKQNLKEMQRCAEQFDSDEIHPLVSRNIMKDDFPQVLGFFLEGLSQSGQSQILRFKVTEELLLVFDKRDIPLTKANSITSRLKLEVANFSSNHLVKLCDMCVKIICESGEKNSRKSGTYSDMCWKELLPSMLSLLLEGRKVTQHGTQLTGEEYKSQLVKTLVQAAWKPQVASSLAGMFINIPLTAEEHLQVVNKMCSCMQDLSPQDLPTLAHNMLDLCKDRHGLQLLMKLNNYFHCRLYKNGQLGSDAQMLDSDNIEGDAIKETKQALSTVLYHINKIAGSYSSIKEFINVMGKVARGSPEGVLQPVVVSMLFCIATVATHEEQVFGILKLAISKSVIETRKRNESTWMREIRVNDVDIEVLIRVLIDCSKDGQLGVEEGLVNLAFELLRAHSKKESAAERIWFYGTYILLRLIRYQRHVANSVLQRLCDCIIIGEGVQQYIKCLAQTCREMRLVVIEQQNVIIGLLSYLRVIPWVVARQIVSAVLPIVLHAPSVRDNLILVLRKALFSREINTRKMAVHGFIEILKNLKLEIGSFSCLSQGSGGSTFSGYNILSQVSVEVHTQAPSSNTNTKEAICLEVLGALRGCLTQQADVRTCLYQGLGEVVQSNPVLTGSILFWLREHLVKQCQLEVLPPLCFDTIVLCQTDEAILQEPLGALINLVQQVTQISLERDLDVDNRTLTQVTEILDKLINSMGRCQLENFGLDDDVRLMDHSVDNQKAAEVLKQAMGVYEALICYCMNTWSLETPEQGAKIITLHKCYSRLVDYTKSSVTGGGNKKDQGTTQGKTQGEKRGRPGRSFKLPSTVLGLPFLSRALDLLNMEEVSWSTTPASSSVRGKRDFHRYVMGVVHQYVGNLKDELQSGNVSALKSCAKLARKVYYHCISRLNEVIAFDRTLGTVVLESFLELLQMVKTYCKQKWTLFLQEMTQVHANDGVDEQLKPVLLKLHSLLVENLQDDDESNDEGADRKTLQTLASAFSVVAVEVPPDSPLFPEVLEQVRTICSENSIDNIVLVRILMQLLLSLTIRTKAESQLLINVARQLQNEIGILPEMVAEDLPNGNRLSIISTSSKFAVLAVVCSGIKGRLEEVDWLRSRMDAQLLTLSFPPDEDTLEINRELLRALEREAVCHMARCIQSAVSLSICAPEPGQHADVLLRLHIDVFDTLTQLTKYFTRRSSKDNKVFEQARFDKIIKNAGKYLARNMFAFISHIGEKKNEGKKTKRKLDPVYQKSLVLRETRLIPLLVKRKEMFDQSVIKLSKDCKAPYLVEIIKHNSARDFSIRSQAIRKALEDITDDTQNSQPGSPQRDSDNESEDNNDRDQERRSVAGEDDEEDVIAGSDLEEEDQPSKKIRRTF